MKHTKYLLFLAIPLLLLSCNHTKPLEEYRKEAKALDTELCNLDAEKQSWEKVLADSDSIRANNPYFNLDSVKIDIDSLDSVIKVKVKQLSDIEKECQKVHNTYSI